MNYKQQLEAFSQSIYQDSKPTDLLEATHAPRISVYKRNLLYGFIERLSSDFPGTSNYLGEQNFAFFARKMLLEKGITSPNIIESSLNFPDYLASQQETHQDDIVADLARVDLMWSHSSQYKVELDVPKGLTQFWTQLVSSEESTQEVEINLGELERVYCREINGEQILTLQQGAH